jgi:hypothetical protein
VIRQPTSRRRLRRLKAHLSQIKRIDEHVDHANRVALVNETIKMWDRLLFRSGGFGVAKSRPLLEGSKSRLTA